MFKGRFAPKGIPLCVACPPKDLETITMPKFKMTMPEKSSKMSTLKDMTPKKDNKGKPKRGESGSLF